MPQREDYCICCLRLLSEDARQYRRRFCERCQEHRSWCKPMKSTVVRWDMDLGRWVIVKEIPAEQEQEVA